MELKDWVKAARERKGLTIEGLAAELDRSKAAVGFWETGKTNPSYAQIKKISELTGYPMPDEREPSNVEPGPDLRGLIPLISWVQAGDWHGAADPLHPGEAEIWMPSPTKCSPSSYALRVRGDSMTSTHGNSRSYPEGSIIFVDPERRMPVNGDRVIAKLVGSDEVTFKVYKNEDGRQWLQPLNPTHEPIREPFKILGCVVGTWIPE